MMDGWDSGMTTFGWVMMALVWIGLVAVIVWALANLFPQRSTSESSPSAEGPEEILDRRLARGEVDLATYDELAAKLRGARSERA